MKLLQCLTALALCAALTLSPALAAEQPDVFPAIQEYPGFSDVAEADWFYGNVKLCAETGLMVGTGAGFAPKRAMQVSECASIAARVLEALSGEPMPAPTPGAPWYQHQVDYLVTRATAAGDTTSVNTLSAPEAIATRADFFRLLALAVDDSLLAPINSVTFLPDTDDPAVLAFYNAGILAGTDKYGTFNPQGTLSRMECAAMVSRLVRSELRVVVTLADYSPFLAAGVDPSTPFFTGVTAETYLTQVNELIFQLERVCTLNNNMEFNWFNTYGDQTFLQYVKSQSLSLLGVTEAAGTDAYRNFDVQVYYSRLLDLTGQPQGA